MNKEPINLNEALFIGIDAHPITHTALAMNRFEEQKGLLTFDNSKEGINQFLFWLPTIKKHANNVFVGIEGGGTSRHSLVALLLKIYQNIYEVNPLYTKHRRSFGSKREKSDPADAKAIAEDLTKKLAELPKLIINDLSSFMLCLKKTVWFYEQTTQQGVSLQKQLLQLRREYALSLNRTEKKTQRMVIIDLEKQLKNIRKTQKTCKEQLDILLKNQGGNVTSMKGMSTVFAAKIVAHSGGIERFTSLDSFIQYAGIAPKEKAVGEQKDISKTREAIENSTILFIWQQWYNSGGFLKQGIL